MTFAVSSPDMTLEELSWFVDDTIKRALQGQSGHRPGRPLWRRRPRDPDRARSGQAGQPTASPPPSVNAQLRDTNTDLGGGRGADRRRASRRSARWAMRRRRKAWPRRRSRCRRAASCGWPTWARSMDTYEELRSFSRMNGEPVVTFAVFRAKGASEVSVAETVEAARWTRSAPRIPRCRSTWSTTRCSITYGNYEAAIHTLLEGALLAVLVVLAFLRNWRATLIAAVALPLSAIPTFWIMDMLGLLAEPRQLPGDHAGDRHSGRRCDRRDREHRPAHQDGQDALPRRDRGGGRDRACGDRDDLHHRRGLRAGVASCPAFPGSISGSSA